MMNSRSKITNLEFKFLNNKNIYKNLELFMNLVKNLLQRKNNLARNLKNSKNNQKNKGTKTM